VSHPRAGWILGLCFASGAVALVLELSAVRLLAPWFGATSAVWTHVIGVILLALSCGYLFGARLARGPSPLRSLAVVLWVAAAATAWLPGLAAPVAGWFVPEGLALDEAAGVLRWGSLAAAFVLFAPPSFVLGCVAPLGTECLGRSRASQRGRRARAGGLDARQPSGSFATTYWLIPGLAHAGTSAARCCWPAGAPRGVWARRFGAGRAGRWCSARRWVSRWQRPLPRAGDRLPSSRDGLPVARVVSATAALLQVNGASIFQSAGSASRPPPDRYYYNAFALPAPREPGARARLAHARAGLGPEAPGA
jgi:hypothetical protein